MTADLLSSWATNMMLALLTFLVIWVLRHDPQATIEALIQRLWSGPQRGGKDSQPAKAPASSTSLPTGAKLASAFSGPRSRSARTPTTILRMTTKELRAYVISLGGSVDDCVEKAHLQQRALQLSTQHNGQLPERGSAGWTSEESRLEREDLADELPELSAKERDDMLQSWESMNLAERDFTPSRKDLDEQLERAKSEMAACMYRAAYEELSESEANSLVVKMRELKVFRGPAPPFSPCTHAHWLSWWSCCCTRPEQAPVRLCVNMLFVLGKRHWN